MLTVPLNSLAHHSRNRQSGNTWRSVKDWMAERIASNVLMSRLDSNSQSDSDDSDDSDNDCDDLNMVVVSTPDGTIHRAERAKISIVSHGRMAEGVELPTIAVHEGTPVSQIYNEHKILSKGLINAVYFLYKNFCFYKTFFYYLDAVSFTSERQKNRKRRHPMFSRTVNNPFGNISKSTMRAIQAIETAKMRTCRDSDFKYVLLFFDIIMLCNFFLLVINFYTFI